MRWIFVLCFSAVLLQPVVMFGADAIESSLEDRPEKILVATSAGRSFLVRLFDEELHLLPEFHGHHVYWLFHDNYLAVKVLAKSHPKMAKQIVDSIRQHGERRSGKIEILFGESEEPLPFRRFQLVDVKHVSGKLLRTERVTDARMAGWQAYADLLFLAAIAEKDPSRAEQNFAQGIAMWDDKGISDAATKAHGIYPTYKLALAILAAKKLGPDAMKRIPSELIAKLQSMQATEGHAKGGWVTDYKPDGTPIGKANVETSCMAIMALESLGG